MVAKSSPTVSFATSSTEAGPFSFQKSIHSNGNWAGDLAVFVDPQQPANKYRIYSIHVRPLRGAKGTSRHIVTAKLTSDWLDVESEQVSDIKDAREGPVLVYVKLENKQAPPPPRPPAALTALR